MFLLLFFFFELELVKKLDGHLEHWKGLICSFVTFHSPSFSNKSRPET